MRLPNVEWKEISGDRAALEEVQRWTMRDKARAAIPEIDECLGPEWTHQGLYIDGVLRFCVSIEERKPKGYEVHADAAPGLSPLVSREAGTEIMNALLAEPGSRVIAWIEAKNRAARRLARYFMDEEISLELTHGRMIRYATDHERWHRRHQNG